MLKRLTSQRGDTLVEVLIAITVASVVLTGSYIATNRNVQSIQDAQDRDQAVQLVQAQVEQLHSNKGLPSGDTCFSNGTGATGAACSVDSSGTAPPAGEPVYNLSITPDTPQVGTYMIKTTWDDDYGTTSNVTIYYSLGL